MKAMEEPNGHGFNPDRAMKNATYAASASALIAAGVGFASTNQWLAALAIALGGAILLYREVRKA